MGNKGRLFLRLGLGAVGLLAFVIVPHLTGGGGTSEPKPTPPHKVVVPKAKGATGATGVIGLPDVKGITGVNGAQLRKARKIVACIQRANGDITQIQACAQRFTPR